MHVTRLCVSSNDFCTSGIGTSGGILGSLSGRMSKESHGNQSDTLTAKGLILFTTECICCAMIRLHQYDHTVNITVMRCYRRDVLRNSARQEYDMARHEQDPELVNHQAIFISNDAVV